MFALDIAKFLSPYSGHFELLPIVFFIVILTIFVLSCYFLYKDANTKNWQLNWDNKKLDAQHNSLIDLSYSVATKSEKLADIMPGIILIIGLLGTFIGLGLALDKASTILSSADMNNMDNSMSQLMGMMEGLGTKFKTSTWGLLAFLLLKVISSKNGYDERRLNWCAQKIREELDNIKNKESNDERLAQQALLHSIDNLRESLIDSQDKNREIINDGYKSINSASKHSHKELINTLNVLSSDILDKHRLSNEHNLSTLNSIAQGIYSVIEKQQDKIVDSVKNNSQYLASMLDESKSTRHAMDKFVAKNLETIESLQQSANGMSSAAERMSTSASALENVINTLSVEMNNLMAKMKTDLGETISNMDKSFNHNMETMVNHLKITIGDMNESFKDNMDQMSNNLGKATNDISIAVNTLSESVNETMNNVSSSINDALAIQKKAQIVFTETSDNLNEKIIAMTSLVEQLSTNITQGLKAVSESNRKNNSMHT